MEAMREAWTDERLDDLTVRMDRGFDRVDRDVRELRAEMNDRFDKVDARFGEVGDRFDKVDARFGEVGDRFERVEARLDSIQRTIAFGAIAMTSGFLAGFGGIAALIASQQ